jgi:SAM-dependent methyltransferase
MSGLKEAFRQAVYRLGFARVYFRLFEWRTAQREKADRPAEVDGAPLPPPYLIMLVAGAPDWKWFIESGKNTVKAFADYVVQGGCSFQKAQRILDLGCGCGRIARHLPAMTSADIHGADYNPRLVRWCAANLKGSFKRNSLHPPLPYPDQHFDIVYLVSVFTHLRAETQREWLAELRRVTRPGGVILITFHDEDQKTLPEGANAALADAGIHVANDHVQGSNLMATFQTREHARRTFGEQLEVVGIIPSTETPVQQAVAITRRPAG